jgi:hypothetical protein
MFIEEKIAINCSPDVVFAMYADVANWNRWDPDTKRSSIDGPFRTGATGRIAPQKGMEVPMEFVSVVPNRSFCVVSKIPFFTMTFDHDLLPDHAGVTAIHKVTFSGPLAFVFGTLIRSQLRKGLPVTMASLKRHAEGNAGQQSATHEGFAG